MISSKHRLYISRKTRTKNTMGYQSPSHSPCHYPVSCRISQNKITNDLYTKSPPPPTFPLITPPFPTPAPSIPAPQQPHTIPISHLHLFPAPPKFPSTTRRCFPSQLLGVSLWRCTVMPLYWWRAARLWKAEDMSRSSRLRLVFSVWRDGGSVGWGC